MITVYIALASAVLSLLSGGYLGYRYGRSAEAKVQAAIIAASALVAKIQK